MNVDGEFTVVTEKNTHGALTVTHESENSTFHVVSYADRTAERTADALQPGSTVHMELSRAGMRSNVWEATSVQQVQTITVE
ncbi:hypothetical protein [Halalkalirubrum salinum]|uniref:hypothetical protein n=1 Tax=Halalkalirubrum salinum TaxID=2563889 RepID=UPI0010FB8C87|nr:hypothetical protein [Halalkalirubrum salinum]